jgi:hypothetical protein
VPGPQVMHSQKIECARIAEEGGPGKTGGLQAVLWGSVDADIIPV